LNVLAQDWHFIPLKSPRHAVAMDVASLAMRAFQIAPKPVIDQLLRSIASATLAYRIDQLACLCRCQFLDKFRPTAFEFAVLHDRPPDENQSGTLGRGQSPY
jgi:hypothetical protein